MRVEVLRSQASVPFLFQKDALPTLIANQRQDRPGICPGRSSWHFVYGKVGVRK